MKKRRNDMAAVLVLLCTLLLALPAAAEGAYGEANITPASTMSEIRQNPSIVGSGIHTYSREQNHEALRRVWQNSTLTEFVNHYTAEDCAAGLNRVIENYNAGIRITYPLYTDEEIAQEPTLENVEIYYFPAENAGGKYALIVGGNALITSAELREGIPTANRLNELGYTAFVLRYRIGWDAADDAPLQDLARAVQYITEHADEFGVQATDYALVGFSSGAQIAGLFGSTQLGFANYGVQKPGSLMLAYPVNDFYRVDAAYHMIIDPDASLYAARYYDYSISDVVDDDFPPTYFWYGANDAMLHLLGFFEQGPALFEALQAHGVPFYESVLDDAPHSIGMGRGTDAEGWLDEAVAFWEQQTAE